MKEVPWLTRVLDSGDGLDDEDPNLMPCAGDHVLDVSGRPSEAIMQAMGEVREALHDKTRLGMRLWRVNKAARSGKTLERRRILAPRCLRLVRPVLHVEVC